ncbi:response regulator transcription factor [Roseovarius sp. B08]|uniref:response regulator transcription factor n=1 Tax=Roseovarius sp. B08 TaxID=3449223 RepID=UPI003EDCA39D
MVVEPRVISVVDDDSSVRAALGSLLRSDGFDVRLYPSGEDFLADRTSVPDCLVCDIKMPGMSGWDLCAHLKALNRWVPTILITAYPDERTRPIGLDMRILEKPFDGKQLVHEILSLISHSY